MYPPFIFVSTYKLNEGQLENYKQWTAGLIRFVKANEPRVFAFNLYVNDAGTEVTSIQVHPDAGFMELHMQVVRQYIQTAYGEFLDAPTMILVCGEGDAARQMIRQLTPTELEPIEMPQHIGGFTRSADLAGEEGFEASIP